MEKDNPYFRLPIGFDPHKYYGSAHWVQVVLEEVTATVPRDIELIGLPGMAKTTLLRYLAHPQGAVAQHPEWLRGGFDQQPQRLLPVLVEYRLLPQDLGAFDYLYECLRDQYALYRQRRGAAAGELPSLDPPPGGPAPDSVDAIDQALRVLSQAGLRPVLLLDDFDLAFEPMTAEQVTRLRPWRALVAFVLVTERPLHVVNPKAIGSPFFQTLPLIRMGGLSKDEARRLLSEPAAQARAPFPAEDVDFLLAQADGHPYLLILAGLALWETRTRLDLLDRPDKPLDGAPQQVLLGRLQTDFQRTFQLYYERITAEERLALLALVRPGAAGDRDYVALASLEELGLVQYMPDLDYAPFSPLFVNFLRTIEAPAAPPAPAGAAAPESAAPALTGLEAGLYAYLRRHSDRVCTFRELWEEVWGQPVPAEGLDPIRRRTQVTVSRLRKHLPESSGEDIISVRDQGYRLVRRETV